MINIVLTFQMILICKPNKIYRLKMQTAIEKDGVIKYSDYSLPITLNILNVNEEMEAGLGT